MILEHYKKGSIKDAESVCYQKAMQAFMEMVDKGILPDQFIWNSMPLSLTQQELPVLLVVELETMCGTYKQGTKFSNAIDEVVKGDILSRFIELEETDPKYLGDISLSFILAGKDTISVTLSWFLYKLCKNPYVQEKTAQEIRQTTNVEAGSTISELAARVTEENMDKMQYLNATLNETLRLHPAVQVEGKFSSRKSMSSSRTKVEPGLFDP
ncbi:hypothetical protein JHK82_028019 [Glycine max]|nr:hypothetical protein JHK82_028019 [Glycine max]